MKTYEAVALADAEPTKQIGSGLARFFERRGWSPTQLGGVHWVAGGTGLRWLMSLPEWAEPDASPPELARLLRFKKMLALRYPTSGPMGIPVGLYVCREKDYSLDKIQGKRDVKVGLNRCEVRPVEANEFLLQGIECNRDTMCRQGRENPEFSDPRLWKRFVQAAFSTPEIEVLGAFVDGELAAYTLSCLEGGWCNALYTNSRTHLRKYHATHAVTFMRNHIALHRPDIAAVCAGPRRLLVTDGLDDYKIRLGFQLEPRSVVIRLHPALERIMTSSVILLPLGLMRKLHPASLSIQRAVTFLGAARDTRS